MVKLFVCCVVVVLLEEGSDCTLVILEAGVAGGLLLDQVASKVPALAAMSEKKILLEIIFL
jgi:hypothetical protein